MFFGKKKKWVIKVAYDANELVEVLGTYTSKFKAKEALGQFKKQYADYGSVFMEEVEV